MSEPYGPYGEHGQQGEYEQYGEYGQQGPYRSPRYDGYQQGYGEPRPYAQQPPQQQHQPPQQQHQHPQQQGWYGGEAADPQQYTADPQQYTQQWQGQTWETQVQPSLAAPAAAETAYMPTTGAVPYEPQAAPAPAPVPAPEPVPAPPVAGAAGGGDGTPYGPATVAGNTRITDAQRARLEGRSPIIEPGMQPALLTAVLGVLLAGAAVVGSYALVVPLVVLQAVTAAGWFRLNGMWPARQGIALAFLGGLVADVAVLAAGREHGPAAILGTLGVWVLLTLVLQLRSHADPDERMYGLMATVVSAALTVVATGHLAADADAVTVGGVAVTVAVVARALPLPTVVSVVVALLAAAGAGVAVGGMTDLGASGAGLGVGAGVCALIGHRAASYDYPSRFVHFTAGVALPLAAAAPAVWVLGQALG
ncbi:hypothetical protein [Streptomyces sp. NBC_00670]|uniref:hypothetical protein n=1 Tax=Streptomyces sp. NBC_00670 TaxID=2975804 RepID=UPI002E32036A|nr:hypothetical protein [Streptomyces sp. NBC_00670]